MSRVELVGTPTCERLERRLSVKGEWYGLRDGYVNEDVYVTHRLLVVFG